MIVGLLWYPVKSLLTSVKPGDKFYNHKEDDPFRDEKIIKIIGVRKGRHGEKWIKCEDIKGSSYISSIRLLHLLGMGWRKVK